jgi:hypothetical protein
MDADLAGMGGLGDFLNHWDTDGAEFTDFAEIGE